MEHNAANPSLVVAVALITGIVAQSLAQHLRIPGIVLLVAAGILLGPDGLNVVRPAALGDGLHFLVGFAIAVILFEGGLNLEWRRLRREAGTIPRLVTLGALITWIGGTLAARAFLGWEWNLCVLFGSLVIVTGPTVITPLLRRIKVSRKLETILEAEGVFIDAVGAVVAVVALEVILRFSGESLALGFISLPTRLVVGAAVGFAGGIMVTLALRVRGIVPHGLENVFTLSLALAVFQISNALSSESGIVAVIIAGLVVGNSRTILEQELKEFKEQLTVMLIGMLFVLLAADVRVSEVLSIGWPGVATVMALMFVVRPVSVLACTVGTGLTWREKAFLAWMAPRGIVAAAVATFFYERMTAAGVSGGGEMRALVFLVIATTVVVQGLSGGWLARWLNVRRPSNQGFVILGAHELSRVLGKILRDGGEEVLLLDANPQACRAAEEDGLRVLQGNALEERILLAAALDTRNGVVAMLPNDGVNLLFAQKAMGEYKTPAAHVVVQRSNGSITDEMVHEAGAKLLFGGSVDIELWDVRVRRELARLTQWRFEVPEEGEATAGPLEPPNELSNVLLPMIRRRDERISLVDERTDIKNGDTAYWMILTEREESATEWLTSAGWSPDIETPTVS